MNNYVITPDTDIWLLKVPFEMDEENVLSFSNATAQYNYFSSLPKLSLEDATYQRKEGVIRYPEDADNLITYNYCMYRNTAFSTKWFYAFIEDIKFVNPNLSEIKIKTDIYQTWQFDITFHKMFVVREHVNDDTIGKHTIPEGLETGEYICNANKTTHLAGNRSALLIMGVSDLPSTNQTFTKGIYNSAYSGLYYLGFLGYDATEINKVMEMYADAGKLEAIQSLFMCYLTLESFNVITWTYTKGNTTISADIIAIPTGEGAYEGTNITLTRPSKLGNNYTPVNKKLLTYPYMYFNVTNNSGISVPFRYEDFSTSISFKPMSVLTVGGDIKLVPLNYKNVAVNYENSVNGGKYPVCSWTGDIYTNWLTQQSVNVNYGLTGLLAGTGIALATGGAYGTEAIIGGINRIGDYLEGKEKQQLVPDQVQGNINSGNLNYASGNSGFAVYYMSIKDEYAKVIDDFFSAYGYQVNSYKIPNITGRTNWNYVKTSNCNITGDIPQKDLQELKSMFDKGVTIWHNASTFLDYSQSNGIVS